jgi:hypothetical protein
VTITAGSIWRDTAGNCGGDPAISHQGVPRSRPWSFTLTAGSRMGLHDALPNRDREAAPAWAAGPLTRAGTGAMSRRGAQALGMPSFAMTGTETDDP